MRTLGGTMNLIRSLFAALFAIGVACSPLVAQSPEDCSQVSSIRVGVSYFDIAGRHEDGSALEFGYRSEKPRLGPIGPEVGALLASDGTMFGFVGLRLSLPVWGRLTMALGLGAGAYDAGSSVDLGSALEFRSGLEAGFRLSEDHGFLLTLYHLSNAGLGERNPGVEVLGLGYSVFL